MAYDFPDNPTPYQVAITPDGLSYTWDTVKWRSNNSANSFVIKTGDTMTGPLILAGVPTQDLGAVPKSYVDNRVNRAGDTMTGQLVLSGDPTAPLGAASKAYVDAVRSSSDTKFVQKAGDTMTGGLSVSVGRFLSYRSGGNPSFAVYDTAQNYAAGMFLGGGSNLYFGQMDSAGAYNGTWLGYFNSNGDFWSRNAVTATYLHSTGDVRADSNLSGNGCYANYIRSYGDMQVDSNMVLYGGSGTKWVNSYMRFGWNGRVQAWIDGGGAYVELRDTRDYTPNQNVDYNSGPTFNYLGVTGDTVQHNVYNDGSLGINFRGVYGSGVWYAFGWDGHLNIAINGGGQGQLAFMGDVSGRATWDWVNANFVVRNGGQSDSGIKYWWGGDTIGFEWNGAFLWFHLNGGGGIYPLANAYSDARAKYDIAPSKLDCLAVVNAMPLFEFRWRPPHARWEPSSPNWRAPDKDDTPLVRVGMVAQELRRILPESVQGGYGKDPPLGTDHNTMIAALIGAVQQLSAEVDNLKQRVH